MKAIQFEKLVLQKRKEFIDLARNLVASEPPETLAVWLANAMAGEQVLNDHPELAGVLE